MRGPDSAAPCRRERPRCGPYLLLPRLALTFMIGGAKALQCRVQIHGDTPSFAGGDWW
jgi:hypothetical protein